MTRTRYVAELARDFRFAMRMLVRRRAFAVLAIVTIALGIGATTSIFSIVDRVLLRDLPFPDPNRLAAVWIREPRFAADPVLSRLAESMVLGTLEYAAIREQAHAFETVGLWGNGDALLEWNSRTEEVRTLRATASLLEVLRVSPVRGRGFLPSENVLHGPRVAMVSWEEWQNRYGGTEDVIGRRVQLDDEVFTIVGVLPKGLRLDRTAAPPSYWTPALQYAYDQPENKNRSFMVIGRLQPSATAQQAQEQVTSAIRAATGDSAISGRVENWKADQARETRAPLIMLLVAAGVLLLIGCVNVAMLTLGESASRERELTSRIALGASTGRVARQLLAESMTIAAIGALAGAALAWAMTRALVVLAPPGIPDIDAASVDLRVLAFASLCAAMSGVLFGVAPALTLARSSQSTLLRMGHGQSARNTRRTQRLLVAAEVALSIVLLAGGGLLARSLWLLSEVDPGFQPSKLAIVRLSVPTSFYKDDVRRLQFYEETVRRLALLPGVGGASAGAYIPFSGDGSSSSPLGVEGRQYDEKHPAPHTTQRSVLPNYFSLMGIPLRAGRVFDDGDRNGSELVAVLSEAAVRRDFPGENPFGRRVLYQGKPRRVIGVVGDVHAASLTRNPGPAIYVPLAQYMSGTVSFVVQPTQSLSALAPRIREVITEGDGTVSVASINRMPDLVAKSYASERYRTFVVAVFGVLATLLAAVGLYGVTLRAVARRTREVGIRVALGSTPARVTVLMMSDTVRGVAIGIACGVPLALLAGNRIATYLFGVTPRDPLVLSGVVLLLTGIAFMASALPAHRAARTNPAEVLAAE